MPIQCYCMEQDVILEKTSNAMLSFLLIKPRYSINLEEVLEPVLQTLYQSGRSIQACCSILIVHGLCELPLRGKQDSPT